MKKKRADDQRDLVLGHLHALGVPITEVQLASVLEKAERGGWSHLQLLEHLLGEQADARRVRSIERRIREARFAEEKTLETFDWTFNAKAIDRVQIEELATGDFIRRKDNLLLVGQSGVGKSHLLQGIGRRACAQGYRVRYTTSEDLFRDLGVSLLDGTLPKRLRYWVNFELLIIDGFGFDRIERQLAPQSLSLLFKVIDQRNGRNSTALITNIDFDAWGEYLGDPAMVMALLDRLVDRSIRLKINGKSYRAHRARRLPSSGGSPAATKARRDKKAGD